ncbi:DNA-invertase hin [Arthrobacter sp. SO5]|nr:DNA-invertase hin [Arthrobacter sp. SO5]
MILRHLFCSTWHAQNVARSQQLGWSFTRCFRELISERTTAGLAAARARGRSGGRPFKMTPAKLRLALASMGKPGTKVGDLCTELGITRQTLYRHVSPSGEIRTDGEKLLSR